MFFFYFCIFLTQLTVVSSLTVGCVNCCWTDRRLLQTALLVTWIVNSVAIRYWDPVYILSGHEDCRRSGVLISGFLLTS